MAFVCPVHGYYVPTPGITSALCPSCSRPAMTVDIPNGAVTISSVPPEIYAEVDRLGEELRIARWDADVANAELREEVERLREALRAVVAIGSAPRDSMTWNRRECERRGQAMMDAAHGGLNA